MCCRYYIEPESAFLEQLGDVAANTPLRKRMLQDIPKPLKTSGEIRPGDIAPVIATSKRGNKACFPMLWGFNSGNRSLLPNARAETAAVKPLFQIAWRSHLRVGALSASEWKKRNRRPVPDPAEGRQNHLALRPISL